MLGMVLFLLMMGSIFGLTYSSRKFGFFRHIQYILVDGRDEIVGE